MKLQWDHPATSLLHSDLIPRGTPIETLSVCIVVVVGCEILISCVGAYVPPTPATGPAVLLSRVLAPTWNAGCGWWCLNWRVVSSVGRSVAVPTGSFLLSYGTGLSFNIHVHQATGSRSLLTVMIKARINALDYIPQFQ